MNLKVEVLITILGMGLVTYFTRVGGFWFLSKLQLSPRVERGLAYLPGTVLIALVAPELWKGGPITLVAGVATVLVGWRSGNLLVAMLVGVGVTFGLRSWFGLV